MTAEPKRMEELTAADLEAHSVWRFARGKRGDETCLRPVARVPVSDMIGKLVAARITLANGQRPWALVGNIDVANVRLTKHCVTVSVEQGGRWFHLARYHDFDYAERGPQALAGFLGLQVEEVFPITYDVSGSVRGAAEATAGKILSEPEERLSRADIIALAVP
jgi:hypothetical protein